MAWLSDLCFVAWAEREQWRKLVCIGYTSSTIFHDKAELPFYSIYQTDHFIFWKLRDSYAVRHIYKWGKFKSCALNSGSLLGAGFHLNVSWVLVDLFAESWMWTCCSPPEGWAGPRRVHIHRLNWRPALTIRTVLPLKLEIATKIIWISYQKLLL